jgi:hypothetical protein
VLCDVNQAKTSFVALLNLGIEAIVRRQRVKN